MPRTEGVFGNAKCLYDTLCPPRPPPPAFPWNEFLAVCCDPFLFLCAFYVSFSLFLQGLGPLLHGPLLHGPSRYGGLLPKSMTQSGLSKGKAWLASRSSPKDGNTMSGERHFLTGP